MKKVKFLAYATACMFTAFFSLYSSNSLAITPKKNWADSYSSNGKCYCASTFDHGIGDYKVATPQGQKSVREVCAKIGPGPGKGSNPVYNTVQCGHEPGHDDAITIDGKKVKDEKVCPGRVDKGESGCSLIGPKWDLSVYSSDSDIVSQPAPTNPPFAAPAGYKWQRVDALSDNFNGNTLDSTKWYDYHPGWSGRLPSQFKKGNSFVKDGFLYLRSTSRIDSMSEVSKPYEDVWVDAAAVSSKTKMAQPGWYYETSMRASNTAMSSSFWFRMGKFSEIDVIEHIGHATKGDVDKTKSYLYEANTHIYGTQSGASKANSYKMATRGRDEFHRYGLWWKDANNLWFYHNGKKVFEIKPNTAFTENLHMIFDTETLASQWVGLPTIESLKDNSRNAMLVDWVRTWKLVEGNNEVPQQGQIPGKIEAESFYNQSGIKTEATTDHGKGKNIGYIEDGDSAIYKVNIETSGTYQFKFRVASKTAGGNIVLNSNNSRLTSINVANTGGWQSWKTVTAEAVLAAGLQDINITFSGGKGYLLNLNWFEAELIDNSDGSAFKTHAIPGIIQAEDYDNGGEGIGYRDNSTGNHGGNYRKDDVDIGIASDIGGGYMVGWIAENEWLQYTIGNIASGYYDIHMRVAADGSSGKSLSLELNNKPLGSINFNGTGGWQNWQTAVLENVYIDDQSNQQLRLYVDSSLFNINWIEFRPANEFGEDQCNTTAQCRNIFGSGATDCLNSRSDESICMCGTSQCK
ncbi:carbohydrate-binding protein [Corallincola spongiicola]|nr:carbohydrate-binding protein [Corallincola spongiicola]